MDEHEQHVFDLAQQVINQIIEATDNVEPRVHNAVMVLQHMATEAAYDAPVEEEPDLIWCVFCEEEIDDYDLCTEHMHYEPAHAWCCEECLDGEYDHEEDPPLPHFPQINQHTIEEPARITNPKSPITPANFVNRVNRCFGFHPAVNGDAPAAYIADLQNRHVANSNIITSIAHDGFHYPVLNIDCPVTVVPSTIPGHSHVLIDHPVSRNQYFEMLQSLANVGIVNGNWLHEAQQLGASWVRLPWVHHGDRVDPNAFLPFFDEDDMAPADVGNQALYQENVELREQLRERDAVLKNHEARAHLLEAEILHLRNMLAERRVVTTWH